jgi:hypothetical protein
MSNISLVGRAKNLDTSGNKYERVVTAIKSLVFGKETFLSLNNNTSITNQGLSSENEFLSSSLFLKRLVRNDYRGTGVFGCFGKKKWQTGIVWAAYDGDADPTNQNCICFDNELKVTFLCLSNNGNNLRYQGTVSNVRPGSGFKTIKELREHGANPIKQGDGYSWIALLAEANPLTEDSSWSTMVIRDIDFPLNSTGKYVDDSSSDFPSAASMPHAPSDRGAVGFYTKEPAYDPTDGSTVAGGNLLMALSRVKRFDVYQIWRGLKEGLGIDTQTIFLSGTDKTEADLPPSATLTSITDEIRSAFDKNSPVGWYNEMVTLWGRKKGSLLSVSLDISGLSPEDLIVNQKPTVEAIGNNGKDPACEFIYKQLNAHEWKIQGIKITTDTEGVRRIGSDSSGIKFIVDTGNTDKNSLLEGRIKAVLTPTDTSLLTERVLYNKLINIAGYMTTFKVPSSDLSTTLGVTNFTTPTQFDSYGVVQNLKSNSSGFVLGSDKGPNQSLEVSNLIDGRVRRTGSGNVPSTGMSVWKFSKASASNIVKTPPIGFIQSSATVLGVNPDFDITFTSKTGKVGIDFLLGEYVYIGNSSGASLYRFGSTVKRTSDAASGSDGQVEHIGTSNIQMNGINSSVNSVFGIKFVQLV